MRVLVSRFSTLMEKQGFRLFDIDDTHDSRGPFPEKYLFS